MSSEPPLPPAPSEGDSERQDHLVIPVWQEAIEMLRERLEASIIPGERPKLIRQIQSFEWRIANLRQLIQQAGIRDDQPGVDLGVTWDMLWQKPDIKKNPQTELILWTLESHKICNFFALQSAKSILDQFVELEERKESIRRGEPDRRGHQNGRFDQRTTQIVGWAAHYFPSVDTTPLRQFLQFVLSNNHGVFGGDDYDSLLELFGEAGSVIQTLEAAAKHKFPADPSYSSSQPPAIHQSEETRNSQPSSSVEPHVASKSSVVLGGAGDAPIVLGKTKDRLTQARFDVIKSLLNAGENGLTGDELVQKSGRGGAINTLKQLAKSDRDWKYVILLPGKNGAGKRYRIRQTKVDGH